MQVISFEGIGGVGKSTIANRVTQEFLKNGQKVLLFKPITRQRLQDALGVFSGKKERVWVCKLPYVPPRVEGLCYLAFLIKDNEEIFKVQNSYDLVIFDRYIDTIAAHVIARNNILRRKLSFRSYYSWFRKIYEKEIKMPGKTLVLDVDLNIAEQRSVNRENKKYTDKDREGFKIIKKFYKFLAKNEPNRFCFIDANKSIEQVTKEVIAVLQNVR